MRGPVTLIDHVNAHIGLPPSSSAPLISASPAGFAPDRRACEIRGRCPKGRRPRLQDVEEVAAQLKRSVGAVYARAHSQAGLGETALIQADFCRPLAGRHAVRAARAQLDNGHPPATRILLMWRAIRPAGLVLKPKECATGGEISHSRWRGNIQMADVYLCLHHPHHTAAMMVAAW